VEVGGYLLLLGFLNITYLLEPSVTEIDYVLHLWILGTIEITKIKSLLRIITIFKVYGLPSHIT